MRNDDVKCGSFLVPQFEINFEIKKWMEYTIFERIIYSIIDSIMDNVIDFIIYFSRVIPLLLIVSFII